MNSEPNSIIIRLGGEIWIKKRWTRRWYLRRLVQNIRATLKSYDMPFKELLRRDGRVYIRTTKALHAARKCSRVFGISSVSPALETGSDFDPVVAGCLSLAERKLATGDRFAVRCRRIGEHPYSSQRVCRTVGRRILQKFADQEVRVDLDDPDVRLGVEVRDDLGFVFSDIIRGVGGFPLGVQGRVVGLLSGGLDSAVACWLMMKRGSPVAPLYFNNQPYTDGSTTKRAIEVARALSDWAVGFPRRLHIIRHGENLKEIMEGVPRRLTCLLCKRMMYRVAERIADEVEAEGLVTGEAIDEQASQTLRNLRVLDEATERYPVHRPLLSFNKAETDRLARKIGTYTISTRNVRGCEGAPHKPATKAKLEEVLEAESRLKIVEMVERSIGRRTVIDL